MASRNENTRLDIGEAQTTGGPVECIGMTFPNDEARREHFLEILREKLQDSDFRSIEGFPIGEDEDILALSDPPYYTACPNPFIEDFIEHYGTPYDPETDDYHREPFAADVSEGKNDSIYSAHSYHTKVPHKAVMRYVLHYTEPGDIVFDGFCGTGMAGIAAQLCGDANTVESLGYDVAPDGTILDEDGIAFSQIGSRLPVLNDLSPIATFVASRFTGFSAAAFSAEPVIEFIADLEEEFRDYYLTREPETGRTGHAQFYVWSEVFSCPHCGHVATLFALAVDEKTYQLNDRFACSSCNAELSKGDLERVWTNAPSVGTYAGREAKCELAEVCAEIGGSTTRYSPTEYDRAIVEQCIDAIDAWVPTDEFPHGRQTRKVKSGSGIATIPQMYTPRALAILSTAWEQVSSGHAGGYARDIAFLLSAVLQIVSRRERYRDGTGKGAQSGTLYVPSLQIEKSVFDVLERKRNLLSGLGLETAGIGTIVTCQSHADLMNVPDSSIDYIFTDPPFGKSLQYGELNFFHEAWLRVRTRIEEDCVLNYVHQKDMGFYQSLMVSSFSEAYRILKPGRWITVEFHNSQNSVWMAIQEALWRVGFAVADVSVLDKRQGTFNAVNRAGAVKKDLIISAYKPTEKFEQEFELEKGTETGVWDFVRSHLSRLTLPIGDVQIHVLPEREDYMLYDRMVAFHVQRGVTVPLSAAEFYAGLRERFPERDGMFFLPEQAPRYERQRMKFSAVEQHQLGITDESSAIQWLRRQLGDKPQTYQDLSPEFMQQIQTWDAHEEQLELSDILKENFLRYDGDGEVPSQIHAYLSSNYHDLRNLRKDAPALVEKAKDRWYVPDPNKEADLESIRHKSLLKEFEEYRESKSKLNTVRREALRAGFKECWQNADYQTIVDVAERLPDEVVQEDSALLMYYDNALMRTEG